MDEEIRQKILTLLDQHRIMTGLTLYFLCGSDSQKAASMLMLKYPQQGSLPLPTPADVRIFRVTPMVISVLDYSKGFAHTDLVTC